MRYATLAVSLFCLAFLSSASDWPQWRGANHDSTSDERIAAQWPSGGPNQVWKIPVGEGLGTPVVVAGKVYITAQTEAAKGKAPPKGAAKDGVESLICFDANSGQKIWAQPIGPTIVFEIQGNDGPRSTPAVSDGLIYAMGTYLNLVCFDAKDGKPVWSHDGAKEFNAGNQLATMGIKAWGCANSPVVDGNLVFVHCGGAGQAFMAFDKKTGKVAWKGEDDLLTHTTPTITTILGQRQVIFFTQSGLASLAPDTGKVLWRHKFPHRVSTAISPVVCGDVVFCAAGYNQGSGACKITKEGDGFKATELWYLQGSKKPEDASCHWTTPVFRDGFLYGMFGFAQPKDCPAKCVDVMTGKVQWTKEAFGQGGVIFVDGKVLYLTADGQLVLVEPNPKEYKELARAQVLKYKCWNQPVISGGHLYARSNSELVCLDVSAK
ncbi:MAG TPA: PQQ-binding-like beta-propeller repeat protein [Planctomycetota bacterium]|nr:PQQ-binding-like beta-propeller repeat protein [Planctomycetota bacterium]